MIHDNNHRSVFKFGMPVWMIFLGFVLYAGNARVAVSAPPDAKGQEQHVDAPLILKGLDPVELVSGNRHAGSPQHSFTHLGWRYLFCSEENLATFQRDPSAFAVQNQGDAVGFPGVKGTPEIFDVHKQKIYLFYSDDCKKIFQTNPDRWANSDEQSKSKKNVAIFLYPGVELLDFAGPGEVFAAAADGTAFNVYTVAVSTESLVSQGFLNITPRYTIHNCPKPDILVIPGGHILQAINDEGVVNWVKEKSDQAEITMSVCTGAFLLGKAGLLEDRKATTHWMFADQLQKECPSTTVEKGVRFVDNGKVVTAAGVSAGIDGALHVVSRLLGQKVADETARHMEYQLATQK